jgi:RNA polymerase sigma factor (sigma-70 family)
MGQMHADDMDLVRDFAANGSEAAFATLVGRHVNLVYSAALRRLGNPHEAEEVAQAVFIILARKAGSLRRGTILSGWLYQTAQLTAANFHRAARRRQRREQEAFMQFSESSGPDVSWRQLSPLLEEAMARLGQKERDALVLRFFENRTVREVASTLGLREDAAQKRVNRATDKLRDHFIRRGVQVSTAALLASIGTHAVQAAPVELGAKIAATAALKGAAGSGSTLTLIKTTLKIMAWTKAKTVAVAVVAAIVASGTTAIVIKTGAFGIGRGNANRPSETMAKASQSPKIFSNGINNAFRLPNRLFTYPDGDEATHHYLEGILKMFRMGLDPARAIKSDRELTEQDIQTRTIFIYGSPENHRLFQRVRDQLPIVFEDDGIVVGNKKCKGRDAGAIFICPNPLNPKNQLVIYGTVAPEALQNMNGVFHGPTDYVVFNNTTRKYSGANKPETSDQFLLLGSFDKSDPARWRVDESLQLLPPKALQKATAGIVTPYVAQ